MKDELMTEIEQGMLKILDNAQLEALHRLLKFAFSDIEVISVSTESTENSNQTMVEDFLSAKRIEGCSEKTLTYYRKTVVTALDIIGKGGKTRYDGRSARIFYGIPVVQEA